MSEENIFYSEIHIRKRTDVYFILILFVSICSYIALIVYCAYHGDLSRISIGYDDCKNICGKENVLATDVDKIYCESHGMTYRSYLLVFKPNGKHRYKSNLTGRYMEDILVPKVLSKSVARACLTSCNVFPQYTTYKKRCFLKNANGNRDPILSKTGVSDFFYELAEDLELSWLKVLFLQLGSVGTSLTALILFVSLPQVGAFFARISLILSMLIFSVATWFFWAKSTQNQAGDVFESVTLKRKLGFLLTAITSGILALFSVVISCKTAARIRLASKIFQWILKVIYAMPLLLLQPILCCSFVFLSMSVGIYISLWIESSGTSTLMRQDFFLFQKDVVIYLTRWFNIFITIWTIRFVMDCQDFVTSGAVSYWYFCKNKGDLGLPIYFSFYNLVLYHLGSVILGSFLHFVLQASKIAWAGTKRFLGKRNLNHFFKFWQKVTWYSTESYTEVGLFGCNYLNGTSRIRFLSNNQSTAIKSTVQLVVFFIKITLSVLNATVALFIFQEEKLVQHFWVMILLCATLSYIISGVFLDIFQTVIYAIFVCFEEDNKNPCPTSLSDDFAKFIDGIQ